MTEHQARVITTMAILGLTSSVAGAAEELSRVEGRPLALMVFDATWAGMCNMFIGMVGGYLMADQPILAAATFGLYQVGKATRQVRTVHTVQRSCVPQPV